MHDPVFLIADAPFGDDAGGRRDGLSKWAPAGYVELRGAEAKQFLIGNTLAVVKINGNSKWGPSTSPTMEKSSIEPTIIAEFEPHRLSETERLELEPPSLPRCEGYRVFRKAGIRSVSRGGGRAGGPLCRSRILGRERLVLKEATPAVPRRSQTRTPSPSSFRRSRPNGVDRDAPSQYLNLKTPEVFPEDPRGRYLVGNSVVKPADDPGCWRFGHRFCAPTDGSSNITARATRRYNLAKRRQRASIDLLRSWKIATAYFCFPGDPKKADCVMKPVAKRFCLNNPEEKGQFDDCRSLDLETVAVGVGSEWRFQIRVKDGLAGFPGLLVAGDPLGLGRLAPRPRD